MSYLDKETLEYGLSEQAIRVANPDYSPPVPFQPPPRYALVFDAPQPAHDVITQIVREVAPVLTDKGHWQQQWEVVPLYDTQAEADNAIAAHLAAKSAALQAAVIVATQKRLDDFAATRNYDSILSACTYATSAVPKFQAEGQYCVNLRDATWSVLYQLFNDVTAGKKPMPESFKDIEPLLPKLEWPV